MKHFSQEIIDKAKSVNLVEFLQARGVELVRDGKDWRLKEHHSLVISPEKGLWIWNSHGGMGGDNIDYLVKVEHMTTHDAIVALMGGSIGLPSYRSTFGHSKSPPKPKKPFVLPERAQSTRRVFAYLAQQRMILPAVINHFVKAGTLYEGAEYHDAVFVGLDESGVARHAHKKSTVTFGPELGPDGKKRHTRWDVDGSDKRYGFCHVGTSDRVFVFEAPIDMVSHISLREMQNPGTWKVDSYICLNGLADLCLQHFLATHPYIRHIIFCLDNDTNGKLNDGTPCNHGQAAEDKFIAKYRAQGYKVMRQVPRWGKDFNAMLVAVRTNQNAGTPAEN